jgi:hypothetical protein
MGDNRSLFIEEIVLNSVRGLLSGRVNELLGEAEYSVPLVEFGNCRGGSVTVPSLALATCERGEKERIVRVEAYSLTITFAVPDYPAGERSCYAYASTVATALKENPTLDGAVDRAELTGKRYVPPKVAGVGDWEAVLSLRITIEEAAA